MKKSSAILIIAMLFLCGCAARPDKEAGSTLPVRGPAYEERDPAHE